MDRRAFMGLFAAGATAALTGCGGGPPSEPVARQFYEDIYKGDVAGYTALLAPDLRSRAVPLLQGARGTVIPTTAPASSTGQGVGFNVSASTGNQRSYTIAYEYPAHQIVFHTTLRQVPGTPGWQVVQFNYDVNPHRDVENVVRQFYRDLRDDHIDALVAASTPESRQPNDREVYGQMHEQIPAGDDAPANMGWRFESDAAGDHAAFRHRYSYPDRTMIVDTILLHRRGGSRWEVEGFNLHRRPAGVTTLEAAPEPTIRNSTVGGEDQGGGGGDQSRPPASDQRGGGQGGGEGGQGQ